MSTDGAYVREVYAHFAQAGVPGDGAAHGEEYTRHRAALPQMGDGAAPAPARPYGPGAAASAGEGYGAQPPREIVRVPAGVYVRAVLGRSRARGLAPLRHLPRHSAAPARAEAWSDRRGRKWDAMLAAMPAAVPPKLASRAYKGIPESRRARAWAAMAARRGIQPLSPAACAATPSPHDVQIDLDVPRTMPGHAFFHTRYGTGQRALFSVLHAASLQCAECGYCQGMGAAAATLLLYLAPDDALAVLMCLHDQYGFHDVYRPGFSGLRAECFVLHALVQRYAPRLAAALERAELRPTAYATRWLMTCFAGVLPWSTQLRVWDAVLVDGRDVVVVACLALLRALDAQQSTRDAPDLHEALSSAWAPQDDDAFMLWVRRAMHSSELRHAIGAARARWAKHVADGTDATLRV